MARQYKYTLSTSTIPGSAGINPDNMIRYGIEEARNALRELKRLSNVIYNWDLICKNAAKRLEPYVRKEMDISYTRTGLKKVSTKKKWYGTDYAGALYDAWVERSWIVANHAGVIVYIALNMDEHVYKRAGVFQHGGVWGISGKKSSAAQKIRKRIKYSANYETKDLGGGIRTVAPRPIYFDDAQGNRLATTFAQLINEEIEKVNNG